MNSYKISCEIREPVLLNCWKHHAGFIRSRIKQYKKNPKTNLNFILNDILLIGESIMDLYLGELNPRQISISILAYCSRQMMLNRPNFEKWLKEEGTDYRILEIGDRSKWTIRLGKMHDRYIHIHPSRYSPLTIRIRSASLKSAILYQILKNKYEGNQLTTINLIRKEYLNLPPLKNIKSGSALRSLIKLLT